MNKPLKIALGVFGVLLVALLGLKFYTNSQTEAQYEAVVRTIGEKSNGNPEDENVLFVLVQGQNPSPEFLARFPNAGSSVRSGSRAAPVIGGHMTKDAQTGEAGLEVKINSVVWTGPGSAMVFANSEGFAMSNESGTWQVKYMTMMVAG